MIQSGALLCKNLLIGARRDELLPLAPDRRIFALGLTHSQVRSGSSRAATGGRG